MKKTVTILFLSLLVTKLLISQTGSVSNKYSVVQSFKPGLINITELHAGFGMGDTNADYSKSFYGFTSVLGYGITKNINLGIGAGLSFYNGGMLVPFFLDLRGILNFGKLSGYAFGDGGLLFDFSDSDYGNKILINPGIGIKFPLGNKLYGNLGTGLLIQTTKDREMHDSFINLKLGMTYTFRQ
jgi:hypothetical protein